MIRMKQHKLKDKDIVNPVTDHSLKGSYLNI